MRGLLWLAILGTALAGCAADGSGSREAGGSVWKAELRADPDEFTLPDCREVKVIYSLCNSSRRAVPLEFPTAQRLEVVLRGTDGRRLFQWSEDRTFEAVASVVTVNPGERLEYEVSVPTRDMAGGRAYGLEAVLPGYPATAASATLRPR